MLPEIDRTIRAISPYITVGRAILALVILVAGGAAMTWLLNLGNRAWGILGWPGTISGLMLAGIVILVMQATIAYARSPTDPLNSNAATSAKPIVVAAASFGSIAVLLSWAAMFLSMPTALNSPWPDAITCIWQEPEADAPSSYVFYYRGEGPRGRLGDVELYFLVGAVTNSFAHELWFRKNDGKIITPASVNVSSDPVMIRFKDSYLPGKVDCGGETIEQVKASGHGFSLARKW